MNRRDFLDKTAKSICACLITSSSIINVSCEANLENIISSNDKLTEDFNINEDSLKELKSINGTGFVNESVLDPKGLLFIRKSTEEIKVYSRNCTHRGYKVNPFNSNIISVCSSGHGGEFDSNGSGISNPASGSLKSFRNYLDGDVISVYNY